MIGGISEGKTGDSEPPSATRVMCVCVRGGGEGEGHAHA